MDTVDAPVISAEFNLDEMLLLQNLLKITAFPIVLEILAPRDYFDDAVRSRAQNEAMDSLIDKQVVTGGEVTEATVAQWLRVLQRPDIELAARIWREGAQLGLTVCRRGALHVVAMRYNDLITIQPLSNHAEITSVAQVLAPVISALGEAVPANFEAINLPVAQGKTIDERVAAGSSYYTELLQAGVAEPSARFLTDALRERTEVWRSEIVAIEYVPGKQIQSKAAVGVFDTPLGRIVAAPSHALDGTMWSTFAPGTNGRLVTSAELIIETLPSASWFAAVRH
ncbi:ESX secretion-associated protein EspG [Mycobacterium hubeiense]|uniref:ESX secretion-associated protein EspG n=1 Tax=Mycobacterium hubeiense TaxID=1867256 RepID=UPI000C7F48AA|nr:ESX secretion-associated protein EspG [Mycobacterium sp. QGD 101]